jgi:O-antigen/teichoic acid export membrane protein
LTELPPVAPSGVRSRLLAARGSAGLWAIADQSIVSVGSFLVTIVLARTLPASEFGVFGVLLGVLVTATTAHTSLIGIPLMVLSANEDHRNQLPTVALAWTLVSGTVFSAVLVGAAVIVGRPGLIAFAVLALLAGQFQETLRRSLMGRLEFSRATLGDAVSYVGQAAGVAALAVLGELTLARALLVMGVTSLAAAGLQYWQVRPAVKGALFRPDLVRPFWQLGKALIVVNGIGGLTVQSFPWLLAAFAGVASVGSFQALLAVMGFTNPLMLAVNSIITAEVARAQSLEPAARRGSEFAIARRYAIAGGVPLLAYCSLLCAFPRPILGLYFGTASVYRGLGPELRIFLLFSIAQYGYFVVAGVLNARQDTKALFRAQMASALTVPLLAAPLIAARSTLGAVIGAVISATVRGGVAGFGVLRAARQPGSSRTLR